MIGTGLLLDENLDLMVQDESSDPEEKDFHLVIGDCSQQHQHLILITQPGEWKDAPALGLGLENWLNNERPGSLEVATKRQLDAHGFTVNQVTIQNGELLIDAYYEEN